MRLFKLSDVWTQLILIVICSGLVLVNKTSTLTACLILGEWQAVSYFAHEFLKNIYYQSRQRKYYGPVILCLFILGVLSIPAWSYYSLALFIASLFLAIWYATICYNEIKMLEAKRFIHLK